MPIYETLEESLEGQKETIERLSDPNQNPDAEEFQAALQQAEDELTPAFPGSEQSVAEAGEQAQAIFDPNQEQTQFEPESPLRSQEVIETSVLGTDIEQFKPDEDAPNPFIVESGLSDFDEATSSERLNLKLSGHPQFDEWRLDKITWNEETNRADLLLNERELIESLPVRASSTEDWNTVREIIENINTNYPEIAEIYGGFDGLIQIDDIYGRATGGQGNRRGSARRLRAGDMLRGRSHAVMNPSEWGFDEHGVEIGNTIQNGVTRFLRDGISSVEVVWDTHITGDLVLATEGKYKGYYIDKKTGEPYRPEVLDNFATLRDAVAWQQGDLWYSGIVEELAYQAIPATASALLLRGSGFNRGITARFGQTASAEALKDSTYFLLGNILKTDFYAYGDNRAVASLNSGIEEDDVLRTIRDTDVGGLQFLHSIGAGEYNHPSIVRMMNILGHQSMDAAIGYAIPKVGGTIFRPHRQLDHLFDVKLPGGFKWKPDWRQEGVLGLPSYARLTDPLKGTPLNFASLNNPAFGSRWFGKTGYMVPNPAIRNADEFTEIGGYTGNQWLFHRSQNLANTEADMTLSVLNGDNWVGSDALLNPNHSAYTLRKDLRQIGQGTITPVDSPVEILEAANIMSIEGNIRKGSTNALLDPLSTRQLANNTLDYGEVLEDIGTVLVSDSRYADPLKQLTAKGHELGKLHSLVLDRVQDALGRDAARLTPKEFWDQSIINLKLDGSKPALESQIMTDIIASDLINTSIFSQLRDRAVATRAIETATDIYSVDGPMKSLADNLIVGLTNVHRARYAQRLLNEQGALGDLSEKALKEINFKIANRTFDLANETSEIVRTMMGLLEKRPSREVANAILETFSMNDNIHNWTDFHAWMKAQVLGGKFKGKGGDALLTKELISMMRHSMLSGPKTPGRALLGTTSNMYLNSGNELVGAVLRSPFTRDFKPVRSAFIKNKAMLEMIPEAWTFFWKKMETNWNADIRTLSTRFKDPTDTNVDLSPHLMDAWAAKSGSVGNQAASNMYSMIRSLNNNNWTTASTRIMASIDESSTFLMSRVRAKQNAFDAVLSKFGDDYTKLTPELLEEAEDAFYKKLLDGNGDIDLKKDAWLKSQVEEVTLTQNLGEIGQALEKVFELMPILKPWYIFARPGINGLKLAFKNTPLLSFATKESRKILTHRGKDFSELAQYGITNVKDLDIARNLLAGRQATGAMVTLAMFSKYSTGELTGNGPADPQLRQQWINSGWKPNIIKFGDVEFNYSSLEPFNMLFSAIADIGDNQQLMGDSWATERISATAFVIGRGLTNKTYLSGLADLMEILSFRHPSSFKKAFDPLNSLAPLGGMRNEIGKFLNPYMKELNSDMWSSIRNKNQYLDLIPNPWLDPALPKSDLLNGKPINDWNFFQRGFNAISPIQVTISNPSPGRELLFESNYDLNTSTFSYGGYDLSGNARVRALFQSAIGNSPVTYKLNKFNNLEEALDHLAGLESIQESLAQMKEDSQNPSKATNNPNTSYYHNTQINYLFRQARSRAWRSIKNNEEVIQLMAEQDARARQERLTRSQTNPILQLNNP